MIYKFNFLLDNFVKSNTPELHKVLPYVIKIENEIRRIFESLCNEIWSLRGVDYQEVTFNNPIIS